MNIRVLCNDECCLVFTHCRPSLLSGDAAAAAVSSSLTSSLTSSSSSSSSSCSSSSSLPSRALPVLVTVAALQCCCEGKVLSDLNAIYLIAEGGLSIRQRASWLSLFGLAMVASGRMAKVTIEVGGNAAGDGVVRGMCVLVYCACGVPVHSTVV